MASLVPGFTILKHLGRGAGSHIFWARDIKTKKEVALKRVLYRSPEDEKYLAQLEHEYEIARKFDHPNLRRCYEIRRIREGDAVRELLLVMEMVHGTTLEQHRPTQPLEALEIFIGVAAGLGTLHEQGLVHCDVKPRNVMLDRRGLVKIIDFGQTCPIGTAKDRVQGTPDFLAPEQVRLDPIDRRTDVFGLGATMYWALTGRGLVTPTPAEPGDPWPAVDGSLLRWSGPPSPRDLNAEVPQALSELVMRACRERACDRHAHMADLAAELKHVDTAMRAAAKPTHEKDKNDSPSPGDRPSPSDAGKSSEMTRLS